jgi:RNA-binding protein
LTTLVQIGKSGITPRLMLQLTQILFDHELVKVKLGAECPLDRFAAADRLAAAPGVNVVQILGKTILLYKRHPQTPRYEGKGLLAGDGDAAS